MTSRPENRRCISVTCKPDLYDQIQQRCEEIDWPIAVWARELMKRELQNRDMERNP